MTALPIDDRATDDALAAKPALGRRIVALYRGVPPGPGATTHDGMLLGVNVAGGIATDLEADHDDRSITEHDRIIHLEPPANDAESVPADEQLWLLVRHQPLIAGARLLVIEDNEINGEYYQEVLVGAGAETVVAATAAAGLDLATEQPFDLALVDVRLPDANGYELCRLLASIETDGGLACLLMSADPTTLDSAQVTSVGASGFVVNPVRPAELIQTVATALGSEDRSVVTSAGAPPVAGGEQPVLRLFGRAAVRSTSGWTDLPVGRSADILATLAAACPQSVSAERLSRVVWDRTLTVSANAMYTAVSRLRRQLEGSLLTDAVITDGTGYRLGADPESIDLVAFGRRAQEMIGRSQPASITELGELLEQWSADPFPSTRNEVLVNWRHRLNGLRAQARELLAVRLTIAGRAGEAGQLCRELVLDEPWRESAWSLLVVALYRAGRQNDALNAHRAAVLQLRQDLGLDPGPGLASLEVKVLQHDDSLLDDDWLVGMATSLNRMRSG